MLKYTSRDEVGLLERGSDGLAEVKEAVNRYEEQSPLFGFIQYRRRKVVLKYIPEGTSRLLQGTICITTFVVAGKCAKIDSARVTVQFQSVVEKLTPHDTIFTFATSSELRDSKFSAACSLHTASASVKSLDESLPPRGLAEITEDASESPIDKAHNTKSLKEGSGGDEDHSTLGNSQSEKKTGAAGADCHHSQSLSLPKRSPPRPRTSSSNTDKALPSRPESRDKITPHAILDYGDLETRPSIEGRLSSQSGRPSTKDLPHAYDYKPKVKLGPRPSMDSSASRLEKSNGTSGFRPVSTLPAGLRMPPRKVVSGRPKSSQAHSTFSDRMSSRQPLPPAPLTPIRIPDRNAAIANNGLPTPAKTPEPKSPKMTPEKRRLMKALQIRQKQLAAQKSVTDNGIEMVSDEQENTGPDTEDSVSSTVANGVTPLAESQSEQVSIPVLNKEEQRDVEASPISLPETHEEPSTQASSITDDEEVLGRRNQDLNTKSESTTSEPSILEPSSPQPAASQLKNQEEIELPSRAAIKDGQGPATSDENLGFEVKARQPELVDETLPFEEQHELLTPHLPSESPLKAEDGRYMGEGQSERDDEDSTVVDVLPAAHSPPPEVVGSTIKDIDATDRVLQTARSNPADKLSEHGLQSDHAPASQVATEHIESLGAPETSSSPTKKQHLEHLNASEVPLPPVDDDEELGLSAPQATGQLTPTLGSSHKLEIRSSDATSIDKCQSRINDATATETSSSNNNNEQDIERRVRRQGVANPMQRVSSSDHLEEHLLSDESFMEELKSATLQEAKPMSVSKSPMKPVFSRSESEKSVAETRASRSVSSPLTPRSPDEETFIPRLPTPLSARSFSASQSPRSEVQQTVPPLPKKIGVSSGISQRIRALEQLSARPASPSSQTTSPITPVVTSLRKTSQRGPPAASDVGSVNNMISRPSTAYPSPTSSPETVKSNPFKQFTKPGSTRPESVTVTATIVRDARNKTPETPLNLSEPRAMDLHQSPLVVEHQPMGPPPLSPLKPPRPRYARYSSARSGSSSSTDRKGDASPTSPTRRRDSFASIRSKSSRTTSDAEVPRTISDNAPSGATTPDGTKDDKKDSKRSRLMKRMSSISSMSRRSIAQALSPSPKESPIMEHHEPILETPPSSTVDVGDVNVQFPDTLVSSATSNS